MNASKTYEEDLRRELSQLDLSSLKGTKILVTGGLGLIGSTIVDLLMTFKSEEGNCDIWVADINPDSFDRRYAGRGDVKFILYDASRQLSFEPDFDYIVHCAGLANPDLYVQKPVETMLSNLTGIKELLSHSIGRPTKKIVYVSSSEIYGKQTSFEPYPEHLLGNVDPNAVRSSYPIAKLASELLVKSYASEYGVPALSVRPGHIFGPFFSPMDSRIASLCIRWAAHGEGIVLNSAGIQRRSFCYSVDCAGAILHLLAHGTPGEAYNIGASEITTVRQMAAYAAEAGGVSLSAREPTAEEKKQANPMDNSALDSSKLIESGYHYQFGCREAIEHSVSTLKETLGTR